MTTFEEDMLEVYDFYDPFHNILSDMHMIFGAWRSILSENDAVQKTLDETITEWESSDVQECSVCLDDFKEKDPVIRLQNCGHVFHRACIEKTVAHKHEDCPTCRTPMKFKSQTSSQSTNQTPPPLLFSASLFITSSTGRLYYPDIHTD